MTALGVWLTGQVAASAADVAQHELLIFDEPVVAAAKHPQTTGEAAADVTVISREQIARYGYRTLAEALRSVRGFYTSDDRNYASLGVNGFLRPGDYNDRILLLVNGHTYNDDIYQMAFLDETFGIPMEAIERIEVVRGPGSALYGGNAMFAVINVITANGATSPGARVLAATGSFGRKRGGFSLGHAFANGADVYATGSVTDLDGHRELFYPEFDSPETHDGIARKADGARALDFFLIARSGGFTLQGGASTREKHVPTASFGTLFGDPKTKTIDSRHFGELEYRRDLDEKTVVTARGYYDGYHYHGTYAYADESGTGRIKNEDFGDSDWLGAEIRAKRSLGEQNSLTAGVEYVAHPGVRQRNFDLGEPPIIDTRERFASYGFYAQDEWRIVDPVTLVLGLRYDRAYAGAHEVSPRAAVLWSLLARTRLKLLYGHAFRPPNLYERYYEAPGNLANPDLDAETIDTWELVLEQGLWRDASLVGSVFHNEIGDLIGQTVVDDSASGESSVQYRNGSDIVADGVGFEIRQRFDGGASAAARYSFQDVTQRGSRLSNSPRHLGGLAVALPVIRGFAAAAELIVVGPRLTLRRERLSTVTLANLNLTIPTPIEGFELSVGLYNLLNQKYSDPGAGEHVQDRIPQDRFSYRAQAGYRW